MPKRNREEQDDVPAASGPSETIRICVGSYEHVLYGIDATVRAAPEGLSATFKPVYMFEAHTAQIKSCAIGGRYLASGGVDEVLKLYDLKNRRELGSLLSHDGSITTIKFAEPQGNAAATHMLSGDENNRIVIWRCKDWTPLIQLTTRHGVVNDLSIHPSGKICISVGRDRNVRLWNLVTGKKAAAFKLGKEEPLKVRWNATGDAYAILFDSCVNIYDMSAVLQHSFKASRTKFHDLDWFTRTNIDGSDGSVEQLVASRDDGAVDIFDVGAKSVVQTLKGHKTRVKSLCVTQVTPKNGDATVTVIVSGSTDGDVLLWSSRDKSDEFVQIGNYNCGDCRITCLAVCDAAVESIENVMKRRMKQEESDDDDEDTSVKEEEVEETIINGDDDSHAQNDDGDDESASESVHEDEFAVFD